MNVQAMTCRRTFDFVWSKEKNLKLQINQQHTGKIDIKHQQQIDDCKWCEIRSCVFSVGYKSVPMYLDISQIFFGYSTTIHQTEDETYRFTKQRTVIVEDTPQYCPYNYGNAIFVPTYKGDTKMQSFLEDELECCEDVRFVNFNVNMVYAIMHVINNHGCRDRCYKN